MTLLTPLALVLAILSIPIILLYVLKLRREQRIVASTFLWRRTVEDIQANAPWQRLRPSILLFLQLLILLTLVVALATPAYTQRRSFSGDVIVIVDQSYGMQAQDVTPSRFAVALARTRDLAHQLAGGNVMSVIGMGSQPHLAVAESDDSQTISQGISSLRAGVSPPNFLAALSLASSLARSGESAQVVVFTSRDSGITRLPADVPFPVEIVRIGGRVRDLGITNIHADVSASYTNALVRLHNFGARVAGADLDLFADGRLADVRPVTVQPGRDATLVWSQLPLGIRKLQAHLTLNDDVPGDKTAQTAIPVQATRHVLLVTPGNYFLQTALSLDPSVQLGTIQPSQYAPGVIKGYDLVVFDAFLPSALPRASVLIVAPPAGAVGPLRFGNTQPLSSAAPISGSASATAEPLLKYVDLSDVHAVASRSLAMPASMQPVAASGKVTVIAAGTVGDAPVAVLTFDPQKTDWPLRLSYPIVVHNLLQFLAPGTSLATTTIVAGQPMKLSPGPNVRELLIQKPDSSLDRIHPPFATFADTGEPGFYTVREIGSASATPQVFAVNLFPPRASPARGPAILHLGRQGHADRKSASVSISVAWIFGLAALTLLSAEWWYALRR